jgi:hypothetical protein
MQENLRWEKGHLDTIFPHFNIEDEKENRGRKNHSVTGRKENGGRRKEEGAGSWELGVFRLAPDFSRVEKGAIQNIPKPFQPFFLS